MTAPKIDSLLADLQKKFGERAVMRASEVPVGPPISTGSLALDFATGYGGFPSDRVVEIYGRPGTGKTTLALLAMLNALAKYPKKHALFMDVEHKITKEWLELIVGADLLKNRVLYVQPTSIENATNMYREAVGGGDICCAILDSIGGAPTVKRNDDAEVGHYGGNAMGVGEFARSASVMAAHHSCLTIGINQVRANMGMGFSDQTPGGHQWKHTCILSVELVRGKDTVTMKMPGEEKPVPIGYTVYAKIRKNQVGAPGRVAYYWFYNIFTEDHGFGVDQLNEISRLSLVTQVVRQTGGWYHHPAFPKDKKGEHKVQGLNSLLAIVKSDDKLRETLVSEVLASLKEDGERLASAVAPMSDAEARIEPTPIQDLWIAGENV